MKDQSIEALATVDTWHWMYRSRRNLIDEALARLGSTPDGRRSVLDVGCGPGGTTMDLASIGPITAVDPSPAAERLMHERIPTARFLLGGIDDLDELLGDQTFDLVTCFGALNHESVSDPNEAVRALGRRVAPGGALLLEEPADPGLRRQMDVIGHSARRFHLSFLTDAATSSGLEIVTARYVHGWAWPVARVLAWKERRRPRDPDQPPEEFSTTALARTAYALTRIEAALARRKVVPPKGTGCWVAARRPVIGYERSPVRSDSLGPPT